MPEPTHEQLRQYRFYLKDTVRKMVDFSQTDQHRGVPPPPVQKPCPPDVERVALPDMSRFRQICRIDLLSALERRQSRRRFAPTPLSLDELAFLLWATQGVRRRMGAGTVFRTVPSAGARHPFETYLCVRAVDGLSPGLYRYLALEHQLARLREDESLAEKLGAACFGQAFIAQAAATFIWTALPYRTEWRYGLASYKVIAVDAGHVCQNLYLACEAIGAGTCAIGAYDQEAVDALIGVDDEDEFAVYLAPVGKVGAAWTG